MIEKLIQFDKDLFIYLNGLHTPWLDQTAFYMSKTYFWFPLHLLLLFLIFKSYGKHSWIVLIGIALSIAAADQITSGLMKPFFMRLRPSHEPSLQQYLIHFVNDYKGGRYGFASSHAADTFALATSFFLLFRHKYRYVVLLFLWAVIVSYTRIYLGVHYPGDIVVGWMVGAVCGALGWWGVSVATRYVINSSRFQVPGSGVDK